MPTTDAAQEVEHVQLTWYGAYSLYELNIPGHLRDKHGIYMFCIREAERYFPHYVGETGGIDVDPGTTFLTRLVEHRYGYLKGTYALYDAATMRRQNRLPEYDSSIKSRIPASKEGRYPPFSRLGEEWLSVLSVFLAPIDRQTRGRLEEIEAAVAHPLKEKRGKDFARYYQRHHVHNLYRPAVLYCTFENDAIEGFTEPVHCLMT